MNEAEVIAKRLMWFRANRLGMERRAQPSPRDAYEMFVLDYLGLTEDQVPVVAETETEVTWLSTNKCPTLERCQAQGLDTRTVCRAVYEKPTQMLISQLDPQLRFWRDYNEIRPYAPHCRETIFRVDFDEMMRSAIQEARESRAAGNKGYGAVIVMGNQVIARAGDTAVTEGDPSCHAEVNAVRRAVRTLGDADLCGAILFATCEPCPMCTSLAVWANLTTIVYGVSIEETASLGKSRILVSCKEIIARAPGTTEVVGNVLRQECRALYV